MGKNILITSGGTREPIDRVRSITNTSTGALGSHIAKEFSLLGDTDKIFYVHGKNAVLPECDKVELVPIVSTDDLLKAVNKLCKEERIDVVVHCMAVSDFRVRSVLRASTVLAICQPSSGLENVFYFVDRENLVKKENKIRSDTKNPVIFLEKTPKVLPVFRELLPDAVIVGFKLLDGVSHEELIDTAYSLLENNSCDYVLANDYRTVEAGDHQGFLIDRDKNEIPCSGKAAIAKVIAETVSGGMKK